MKKHRYPINREIAATHALSRKTQTLVAALGATFGVGFFIFINTMMTSFSKYSEDALFKTMAHLRVFPEDVISQPLRPAKNGEVQLISNPKINASSGKIQDPNQIIRRIKAQPEVTNVNPKVSVNSFFKNGQSEVSGSVAGIQAEDYNAMFDLASSIVAGDWRSIQFQSNGLILSTGIAQKLNLKLNDNVIVASGVGVNRLMKVVALLKTGNATADNSMAYCAIPTAQQLAKKGPGYINDISIKLKDYTQAPLLVDRFRQLTGYEVEDYRTANAAAYAAESIRDVMNVLVPFSILLVAAFGIYNIMNMVIMQKMNDIAILKAIGFSGRDVISIFLQQAIFLALLGIILGMGLATGIIWGVGKIWVGGDIGYFPIQYFPAFYLQGFLLGFTMCFLASYLPASKAAKVDPVTIFRK